MIKHAEERKHEVLLTTQSETLPEIAHIVKNILAVHNYFPLRWSEQTCKTTNTLNWRKMAAQAMYNAQEWEYWVKDRSFLIEERTLRPEDPFLD